MSVLVRWVIARMSERVDGRMSVWVGGLGDENEWVGG